MTRRAPALRPTNTVAPIRRYPSPNRLVGGAEGGARSVAKFGLLAARWPLEDEPVGVVQQAIADGVGQGRVADVIMTLTGWELAGDDRRAAAVAILEDLEQIPSLLILG